MKATDVYRSWAPEHGVWTPWVKPVLLACLGRPDITKGATPELAAAECTVHPLPPAPPGLYSEYLQSLASAPRAAGESAGAGLRDLVVVIDLPGASGTLLGARLATQGFRPVPLYNSIPAPGAMIDMAEIMATLVDTASALAGLAADAPPVFLLDARRLQEPAARLYDFDNRAVCRPTDFPSAEQLWTAGIRRCLLIKERADKPAEDLAETLLTWQERGLALFLKPTSLPDAPTPLFISRPTWLRRALSWLHRLGLYPQADGSFGRALYTAGGG